LTVHHGGNSILLSSLNLLKYILLTTGNSNVVDGEVANNKKINENELEEKNNLVEYLIKKNDLVLKYNYFNEIMSEESLWKK
jgi:hypothetical protein